MSTEKLRQYVDLDLRMPRHPSTGDVGVVTGARSVLQSIRNLVLTNETELLGDDIAIGGGLNDSLFKLRAPLLFMQIKSRVEEMIRKHEPRADIDEVSVYADENDRHGLTVHVRFYVLNMPEPFDTTIQLTRTR